MAGSRATRAWLLLVQSQETDLVDGGGTGPERSVWWQNLAL